MAKELTQGQIDRHDEVDDAIYNLLLELSGKSEEELEWDMEHIGDLRDAVQEVICGRLKIMSPMEFYPWIKNCGNCDYRLLQFKADGENIIPLLYCRVEQGNEGPPVKAVNDGDVCDHWK